MNKVDPRIVAGINVKQDSILDHIALQKYYVNVKEFGAKGDGVTDDLLAIRQALSSESYIFFPPGEYLVSDTIQIGPRGKGILGASQNPREYGKFTKIKYIGSLNNKKAVIMLGSNDVGSEPAIDGSDVSLNGVIVDANNLAGFGIYGTYITNDSSIEKVTAVNSLEYNMYFARSWYATFRDLVGLGCRGNGLAFGMPLEYLDGSSVVWNTAAPLEMNNCLIENIRSWSSGRYFSIEKPNTYNPTNISVRRKGYGIGAGIGNSFLMDTFTSEKSGGTGLYVYSDVQPLKTIRKGYIEANCLASGLDASSVMANLIIENIGNAGGPIILYDIFMNYNSGGIYHTGVLGRKVWLKNIQQPRFLKSLDGLTAFQLYAEVLKENVYYMCGYYNTLDTLSTATTVYQIVNTKGSFTINAIPQKNAQLVMVKGDGTVPFGSYVINFEDGTNASRSFPTDLSTTFVLSTVVDKPILSITKGGSAGATDSNVTFKLMNMPQTYI